jgi:hypothetical protein
MMRALLWISVLMAALWSGYWFVGKSAVERGFAAFVAQAPARGLEVSQAGYAVAGFPSRFDLTVTDPRVVDLRSETVWEAPFVQVFSLSYQPWHVIAAFAPTQTIRTPAEDLMLASTKLQASVVVTPSAALTLDRTTVVGEAVRLTSSLGWEVAADQVRFATRADPSLTNAHDIGLELIGLTPDAQLAARLPDLPVQISLARVDANVTLSGPIDRFAAATRPQVTAISLRKAALTWGDLAITAQGDLTLVNGVAEGRIDIKVSGWRNLLTLATSLGLVTPDVAQTMLGVLTAYATSSGDAAVLQIPLVLAGGFMSLGPLPLGPVPRLDQRQ